MATFTRKCAAKVADPFEWMVLIGTDAAKVDYVYCHTFPEEKQVRNDLKLHESEVFLVGRQ